MTKADWKAFSELMLATARITNSQKQIQDQDALLLMYQLLAEYSIEDIQLAVRRHLRTDEGKFFPTVSHILAQINGTDTERENEAWRIFLRAVDRYGYYENIAFPELAYHWAIEQLGGWVRVSNDFLNMSDRERQFRKSEFIALYRAGQRRANKFNTPSFLKGFYSLDNEKRGFLEYVKNTAVYAINGAEIPLEQLGEVTTGSKRELPARERVNATLNNIFQSLAERKKINA